MSLPCGSEDRAIGNVGAWLELKEYLTKDIDVMANDASDEDFWERYAPMSAQRNPFPLVSLEAETTFHWDPNAGDYLIWVRCANPLSNPPEFVVVDFWEFREGDDSLLITNRKKTTLRPSKTWKKAVHLYGKSCRQVLDLPTIESSFHRIT